MEKESSRKNIVLNFIGVMAVQVNCSSKATCSPAGSKNVVVGELIIVSNIMKSFWVKICRIWNLL